MISSAYSAELESAVAEASPYFSAVTLILVGDAQADLGLTPTVRLSVGCDVAEALTAL